MQAKEQDLFKRNTRANGRRERCKVAEFTSIVMAVHMTACGLLGKCMAKELSHIQMETDTMENSLYVRRRHFSTLYCHFFDAE